MFSQKLRHVEDDELRIDIDPCYEADPYELKLDEMIDAEPEPEVIEGLPASDALTPADRYLELFTNVQKSRIFADSKTFPDCAPKHDPLDILRNYRKVKRQPDFDLRQFVEDNFWLPESQSDIYISDPSLTLKEHIDKLWPVLTREPQDHIPWSSLLALPQAYIVPGGRFSETYYWDSYFTMLGLAESGREDLLKCMADNFAWLIETYGHIPNGNRTYYLSRSQPPVFALMVELFEEDGVRGAKRYLDHLKMEHAFWMDGAESLIPHQAYRHVVRMPDGSLLNRYWDDRDTPRDESWREDVETARHSGRPANEVYRDLRAGAASGWDYSSRWLRDITRLASIRTTQFIPIDLNAFLFKLETTIANLSGLKGDRETEAAFRQKAQDRRAAAICGMMRTAVSAIMTGAVNSWRCFPQPVSSPFTSAWRPTNRQNALPMRCGPACSPPGGSWPPNTKAVSSGINPTAGRRCSGWRSRDLNVTARIRWEMRLPGAGCRRSTTFTSSITS